jgi:hypothetical protein
LGKWSITYLLEEDRKDLLHITQSFNRWYSKTSNSDTLIRSAGDDFLDYIASHPTYDQLRWIDESGMERIRVNSKEGHTVLAAPSELQNKSGRYYFEDARKLDFGKVYVSELDLNIENGKIEIPYKPVLRYSTPATECHGDRQGVIVLNRLGSDLINNFKTFTKASAGDVMLLNRDGFILSSPRTEDEWGFMLDRSDLTLPKRHPAAWQHISGQDKGQFLDDSGLWT